VPVRWRSKAGRAERYPISLTVGVDRAALPLTEDVSRERRTRNRNARIREEGFGRSRGVARGGRYGAKKLKGDKKQLTGQGLGSKPGNREKR